MTKSYQELLNRKRREYGTKFSPRELSKKFIPFYENENRIKVLFSSGEIKRGRVGVTTGWVPAFILMLTSRSRASSWILSNKDKIIIN